MSIGPAWRPSRPLCLLFVILALVLGSDASVSAASRTVVLTIDDFPAVGPRTRSIGENITRLTAHVTRAGVPATAFVIGGRGNLETMRPWIEAGLALGNHTLTHPAYSQTSIDRYLEDIRRNEDVVRKRLGVELRGGTFRFPYLDHGNSPAKVDAVERYVKKHGYSIAHVSLDTVDYRFAQHYPKATDRARVGQLYLDHIRQCTDHFAALSRRLYDREIPLILLIHANELNADLLGKVIAQFRDQGYTWIALEEALRDEAYAPFCHRPPKVVCTGDRNFLNQVALTRGLFLPDPSGDRYFQKHWLPKIRHWQR